MKKAFQRLVFGESTKIVETVKEEKLLIQSKTTPPDQPSYNDWVKEFKVSFLSQERLRHVFHRQY
jgi:hypothetical protein